MLVINFLNVGNDIKAHEQCPCLRITTPEETAQMLIHVSNYCSVLNCTFSKSPNLYILYIYSSLLKSLVSKVYKNRNKNI